MPEFIIREKNEYGTRFVDLNELPYANIEDYCVNGPYKEVTFNGFAGGIPFGASWRKEWYVKSKLSSGAITKITHFLKNDTWHIKCDVGDSAYAHSFDEALQIACNYLQAKEYLLRVVNYNWRYSSQLEFLFS